MSGRVELVKGDMFEGPSDLVVIPCSTIPTISWFVQERLEAFDIPQPQDRMRLGDVIYCSLSNAGNVAPTAAFAASVLAPGGTSLDAIYEIGRNLGDYAARTPSVRRIACPILGAGAGLLNPQKAVRALTRGFLRDAPQLAVMRIFCLDEALFAFARKEIVEEEEPGQQRLSVADRPLRVFVSYTRSSDVHANWVKSLATFLRNEGIDARLDVWHLRHGMDVAQWMCNELDLADRVLLICDILYSQKADRRHGGVGWEIRLMQGDLLQSQEGNPDRFVPVIVADDVAQGTPSFLRSTYCLHWPESKRADVGLHRSLLRTLLRREEVAPPLGRPSFTVGLNG